MPRLRALLIPLSIMGAIGIPIVLPNKWGWGLAVLSALGGLWLVREWVRSLPERPGEDDGAERP